MTGRIKWGGLTTALLGSALILFLHWLVFFYVATEATMGISQRIYYVHVPSAWVAFVAFATVGVCSVLYLWLRDERLDMISVSAAEGGMIFTSIFLISGPLWGKFAWGTYWAPEPRLTFSLLLWFIFLGYFLVRKAADNPEQGRKFAAVVGIVGALDIPIIHQSVQWFPSLHPKPVVMRPEGSMAQPDMTFTLLTGFLAMLLFFIGVTALRYGLERAQREVDAREQGGAT